MPETVTPDNTLMEKRSLGGRNDGSMHSSNLHKWADVVQFVCLGSMVSAGGDAELSVTQRIDSDRRAFAALFKI